MNLNDWWCSGTYVEVGGHRHFTRVEGEGPTLVFLHGFPTSSHDWAEVIAELAPDHRCVTFDHLGYGASDKPADAEYSSTRQTDRALAILERLGVESATVVGHDLGGILLQQFLHRALQGSLGLTIERAVFSNPSGYPELYRPTPTQGALVDPALGKALARQISRDTLTASLTSLFPSHPPSAEQLGDMWTAIARDDGQHLWPEQLVYMAEREAGGAEWVDAMRRTRTPLGFIYGVADPISGAQILARAEADLPAARCIGLPGLGHYPQVESSAAFAAALRSMLATPAPA